MNWSEQHFGSFGYWVDIYMPTGSDVKHNTNNHSQSKKQHSNKTKNYANNARAPMTFSCDDQGNIERSFTYSDFLDYVNTPPAKNSYSHNIAKFDLYEEKALDFFLKETSRFCPFDNIDMDDDKYIQEELADNVKSNRLFDDANDIIKTWGWQNNNQGNTFLQETCDTFTVPLSICAFQLIDWAYSRSETGFWGTPKFNRKDIAVLKALISCRNTWRGLRNSGTDFRFFGTETFDQAMHMARYGWTEKLDKIRKLETEIPDIYKTVFIPETYYSVVGNSVDIGRYLSDEPQCMRRTRRKPAEYWDITHKYVKIVVNISVSWTLGEDDIFERGKNIASVVKALESNNIHTKLILMNQVYKRFPDQENMPRYTIFITLKDYQDKFYLEKLMFPLAHRSFLRRLVFAAKEKETPKIRQTFGFHKDAGYGIPSDIFDDSDENTLYFNGAQYEQDKINEKLAKILRTHDKSFMPRTTTTKLER